VADPQPRRCLTIPGGLTIEVGSHGGRRLVFGPRQTDLRDAENRRPRRVTIPGAEVADKTGRRAGVGAAAGAGRRLLMSGGRRGNRTLYLLLCVVVVFVISWLPLNSLNLLLDLGFREFLFGWVGSLNSSLQCLIN
jgi:hypothetical protein